MQGPSALALWPVTQRWWGGSDLMVLSVDFAMLSDFLIRYSGPVRISRITLITTNLFPPETLLLHHTSRHNRGANSALFPRRKA